MQQEVKMNKQNIANMSEKLAFKKNLLLHNIRRAGHIGRFDLAKSVRMSNSRICDLIQEMLNDGLLIEEMTGTERRGRRAVPVKVNPEYGCLVGFDMEAKRIRLVAVDFAGKMIWEDKSQLHGTDTRQKLLDILLEFIETGLAKIRTKSNSVLGIGLACGGSVDINRGIILHNDMLKAAKDIPLRDIVSSKTGIPCFLEHNIRAMTVAEWMDGAGQHLNNFFCIAVRSGVGGGIVINGKVYFGSHGFAGEAGPTTLPIGPSQRQWKRLDDIISEKALDIEADEFNLSENKAQKAGNIFGVYLAAMATFLDPEAIIVAGGLTQPDGQLYNYIVKTFRKFVLSDIADRVQIIPARLGPFAAAIGATHRCFQMLYPTEISQT